MLWLGLGQGHNCDVIQPRPALPASRVFHELSCRRLSATSRRRRRTIFADAAFDAANVAAEVTSPDETLWDFYHTAKNPIIARRDINNRFRIWFSAWRGRVSKLLTAIAVLRSCGSIIKVRWVARTTPSQIMSRMWSPAKSTWKGMADCRMFHGKDQSRDCVRFCRMTGKVSKHRDPKVSIGWLWLSNENSQSHTVYRILCLPFRLLLRHLATSS